MIIKEANCFSFHTSSSERIRERASSLATSCLTIHDIVRPFCSASRDRDWDIAISSSTRPIGDWRLLLLLLPEPRLNSFGIPWATEGSAVGKNKKRSNDINSPKTATPHGEFRLTSYSDRAFRVSLRACVVTSDFSVSFCWVYGGFTQYSFM